MQRQLCDVHPIQPATAQPAGAQLLPAQARPTAEVQRPVRLAMGRSRVIQTRLILIMYGESLLKYKTARLNDSAAHGKAHRARGVGERLFGHPPRRCVIPGGLRARRCMVQPDGADSHGGRRTACRLHACSMRAWRTPWPRRR